MSRRILLLLEYPTLNGGEQSLLCVLPQLRQHFEIQIAAPASGQLARAVRQLGVPLVPFHLPASQSSQAERRTQLADIIRQIQPDAIHANSLSMSRLSGPVCRDLGIASLGHLRDMMRISPAAAKDLSAHRRLLAVSQATRDWYADSGLPIDRIHVVYNGVDLRRYRPRQRSGFLHRQLKLDPSVPLIGSIGQIGIRKGMDRLLELITRSSGQATHLVLVGQRYSQKSEAIEFEANLRRFAEMQLPGRTHFLGRRTDIHRLLPELTILAHLARQEPLGRVLLEAAACGCCIMATDVGGTSEIFPAHSGAAVLFSPHDLDAAAETLDQLLCSSEKRQTMGELARKRAVEAFDAHRATRSLMRHYHAIM